jgi:cell volume regulation protein A
VGRAERRGADPAGHLPAQRRRPGCDAPVRDRVRGSRFLVQGRLLPTLASRLRLPMRVVEPEPFSLGVRLREEPENLRRLIIEPGATADGASIDQLNMGQGTWISIVLRDGQLLDLTGHSVLRAGDEVLLLTDATHGPDPDAVFVHLPAGPDAAPGA